MIATVLIIVVLAFAVPAVVWVVDNTIANRTVTCTGYQNGVQEPCNTPIGR